MPKTPPICLLAARCLIACSLARFSHSGRGAARYGGTMGQRLNRRRRCGRDGGTLSCPVVPGSCGWADGLAWACGGGERGTHRIIDAQRNSHSSHIVCLLPRSYDGGVQSHRTSTPLQGGHIALHCTAYLRTYLPRTC
ncbi:hypothetical protein IWX90DRAFT_429619 [Phyllosticta citrichinensis]|uniref:Secreted protein n=1 Tax=Phyllosticta citrichinensis TaxID=1130410 RepID=A0ABR1XV99_9PEZI